MNASVPGAVGGLYDVGENLGAYLPDCPPEQARTRRCDEYRLVSPTNRHKSTVIVVGTGLVGAGTAATPGRLGHRVECFSLYDAPCRTHSVVAQGGINAARARKVDGDSPTRFVKDTAKDGDHRGREVDAVCLRLESGRVIDHMEAIGASFAREYDGQLAARSFDRVQVSCIYYTRGQIDQQLKIACAQTLQEQVIVGSVYTHTRTEVFDLIAVDSRAQGIVARDLLSGEVQVRIAHAVVLATGGCNSVYHYSILAMASNATTTQRAHRCGTAPALACMVQSHPTVLSVGFHWQSKTTLINESLHNDGRIWIPVRPGGEWSPNEVPEDERDYCLERKYPAFGNLTPRDAASRSVCGQIGSGHGARLLRNSAYLDFRDALERLGKEAITSRYGNLFEMYLDAIEEGPYEVPMHIAPGTHFTMGGSWMDFDQMPTAPGLFMGGEASNNYRGTNRLEVNSLLNAGADGWSVLSLVVPNYLVGLVGGKPLSSDIPEALQVLADVRKRIEVPMAVGGAHRPVQFHHRLGEIPYAGCGVSRPKAGLLHALEEVRALREEFWIDITVIDGRAWLNQELEEALRVAGFLELAEVVVLDVLNRRKSAGAHSREEYATQGGEAQRNGETWCLISAWQTGDDGGHTRRMESLSLLLVPIRVRNYR